LYRRAAEAATVRAHATALLDGHGQDRALVVLGDLNDEPGAATTQILLGPPGSEIGTPGYGRRDRGDGQRLWNLAPRIPEANRYHPHLPCPPRTHRPPLARPRRDRARRRRRHRLRRPASALDRRRPERRQRRASLRPPAAAPGRRPARLTGPGPPDRAGPARSGCGPYPAAGPTRLPRGGDRPCPARPGAGGAARCAEGPRPSRATTHQTPTPR